MPDIYYDYEHQAWVEYGRYARCGHPDHMDCGCYGREHEGERSHYIPRDVACILSAEEQFIDDYCDTSINDLMEF